MFAGYFYFQIFFFGGGGGVLCCVLTTLFSVTDEQSGFNFRSLQTMSVLVLKTYSGSNFVLVTQLLEILRVLGKGKTCLKSSHWQHK